METSSQILFFQSNKKNFFLITCFYYSYINSRCWLVGHIHMKKRAVPSWVNELPALSFISRQNIIKIGWYDMEFIHQKWHQPILKVSIYSLLILQFWSDRCIWRIWIYIVILLRQLKNSHDRDRKTSHIQAAGDDIRCRYNKITYNIINYIVKVIAELASKIITTTQM